MLAPVTLLLFPSVKMGSLRIPTALSLTISILSRKLQAADTEPNRRWTCKNCIGLNETDFLFGVARRALYEESREIYLNLDHSWIDVLLSPGTGVLLHKVHRDELEDLRMPTETRAKQRDDKQQPYNEQQHQIIVSLTPSEHSRTKSRNGGGDDDTARTATLIDTFLAHNPCWIPMHDPLTMYVKDISSATSRSIKRSRSSSDTGKNSRSLSSSSSRKLISNDFRDAGRIDTPPLTVGIGVDNTGGLSSSRNSRRARPNKENHRHGPVKDRQQHRDRNLHSHRATRHHNNYMYEQSVVLVKLPDYPYRPTCILYNEITKRQFPPKCPPASDTRGIHANWLGNIGWANCLHPVVRHFKSALHNDKLYLTPRAWENGAEPPLWVNSSTGSSGKVQVSGPWGAWADRRTCPERVFAYDPWACHFITLSKCNNAELHDVPFDEKGYDAPDPPRKNEYLTLLVRTHGHAYTRTHYTFTRTHEQTNKPCAVVVAFMLAHAACFWILWLYLHSVCMHVLILTSSSS